MSLGKILASAHDDNTHTNNNHNSKIFVDVYISFLNQKLKIDISGFFKDELIVKEVIIDHEEMKIIYHIKNKAHQFKLTKWELGAELEKNPYRILEGADEIRLIIYYRMDQIVNYLKKCQEIPNKGDFGLIEMTIMVNDEKKYGCIRLDWDHKRDCARPSFHDRRLLIGAERLLRSLQTQRPFFSNCLFLHPNQKPTIGEYLAVIPLYNNSSSPLHVAFVFCEPLAAGFHYIYVGWDDPKFDPSKHAITILPHKAAQLAIIFPLSRTQEYLQQMVEDEYVWIAIRLTGYSYKRQEEFKTHLNFTLRRSGGKLVAKLLTEPPRKLEKKPHHI